MSTLADQQIGFIGFGEAAAAFVSGWGDRLPVAPRAYDIKTNTDGREAARKWADYEKRGVQGCATAAEMLDGTDVIFSMVTAGQASVAAEQAADHVRPGSYYLDCNSCAPDRKRRAAALIDGASAHYVDVAIMSPVFPRLHQSPALISGPSAQAALAVMRDLDMVAEIVPGDIGAAASVKMVRSIMMKGLEALVAECVLAGRRAGVDHRVLDSLEKTYPGFGWTDKAAYMLERMMVHGVRRAEEMQEAALMVGQLGLDGAMARATVAWQEKIGAQDWAIAGEDYGSRADEILARLTPGEGTT